MTRITERIAGIVFSCLGSAVLVFAVSVNVFNAGSVHAQEKFSEVFIQTELQRAQHDPDNTITASFNAPIDQLYDAFLSQLKDYTPGIEEVSFDHSHSAIPQSLGLGSERITRMDDDKLLIQRMLVLDAPHSLAYFTDMTKSTIKVPITHSIAHYTLLEQDDGSVSVTLSVAFKPSSRLTAFLVRRGFRQGLERDFRNVKDHLNRQND